MEEGLTPDAGGMAWRAAAATTAAGVRTDTQDSASCTLWSCCGKSPALLLSGEAASENLPDSLQFGW